MGSQQIKGRRGNKKYNNRIKQNLNYTEAETTDTNQQWENLKHAITRAAKETLRKLKQKTRKPWISGKPTP